MNIVDTSLEIRKILGTKNVVSLSFHKEDGLRASPPFHPTGTPKGGGRGGSRYICHRPPGNPKPTAGHTIQAALDGSLVCKFSTLQNLIFLVWHFWRFCQWLDGGTKVVECDRRKGPPQKLVANERILLGWKKINYA